MANNNNFNYEIPGGIIFLAWIFCWPVGLVLSVLNGISKQNRKRDMRWQREWDKHWEKYGQKWEQYGEKWENYGQQRQGQQQYGGTPGGQNYNYGNQNSRANTGRSAKKGKKMPGSFYAFVAGAVTSLFIAACGGINIIDTFFNNSYLDGDSLGLMLIFGLIGIAGLMGADSIKKRETRLQRIRAIIGNKKSVNLTKLATASKVDIKRIRKDVQRMIDKGEFGDAAYIDLGTNNFMRDPDAEPDSPEQFDYKTVYGDLFKDGKETEKKSDSADAEEKDEKKEKATDRDNFDSIISEIRRLNDEIEDAAVSDRIYKIEGHTKNIFNYVTEHPEAMPQIRTFMNYYLPTTLKLLESYSRIERMGVAGENMQKSKDNIEKTLDLLVVGFEQQIDKLFKNEFIDISSDIGVLEQMMQKDGLSGKSDFDVDAYMEKMRRENEAEAKAKAQSKPYTDGYSDTVSDEIGGFGGAASQLPEQKNG